ncbi:MAG: glycosyltransferase family 2 protein [Candidatus Helarchaeota archaeon]
MNVNVIIPVYNAANFVTQAVESALAQPETAEVILIEDGSPDDSLAVCQALAEKHEKVRLLGHPGGKNRGAGASRNLGIKKAQYEYIAFLDADDYYLPGRFTVAKEIFQADPECDGVYEAIGKHYENEKAKKCWQNSGMSRAELTTMTKVVPPEELFERLVIGGAGHFSLDGLVIRHALLKKVGLLNEGLLLHQDTDFIFRLAAFGRLMPGRLKQAVTIRRVHTQNRISAPRSIKKIYKNRIKMYKATYRWLQENELIEKKQMMFGKIMRCCMKAKPLPLAWMKKLPKEFRQIIRLSLFPLENPIVIFKFGYWKRLFSVPVWNVFMRNFKKLF